MSGKNATAKVATDETQWRKVFGQLQEDGAEFFLNSQLEPTIFLKDDGFRTEWLVDSQRVQDLLVSLYFEITNGGMLKSSEQAFMLAQLREECRRGGRRLTEVEAEATDEEIIVQGMIALVNESCAKRKQDFSFIVFNGRTVLLQQRLRDMQKNGALPSYEEIPIFTNIFVRQLNRLITALRGKGVEVKLDHKEDGSNCTVTKLESFQQEMSKEDAEAEASKNQSSGQSSGVNLSSGTGSVPPDDTDGCFRGDPPKTKSDVHEATASSTAKKGGAK